MKTNYKKPKFNKKWGHIKSIKLETNLVCIELSGGWMTYEQFARNKKGRVEALKFYNSII